MDGAKKVSVPRKDPWARFEAWRYQPDLMPAAHLRRMFPGLGIGFGAFLVACAIEKMFFDDDVHGKH